MPATIPPTDDDLAATAARVRAEIERLDPRDPRAVNRRAWLDGYDEYCRECVAGDEQPQPNDTPHASFDNRSAGAEKDDGHNGHDVPREADTATGNALLMCLADVKPEPVRWLWKDYIPLGEVTVIGGDPKLGKSNVTLDLAARVSTGCEMPDGSHGDLFGQSFGVVLLTHEDSPAHTIRPRLDAAGADCQRIACFKLARDPKTSEWRMPTLADLAAIEEAIKTRHARVLIVDPLDAYVPGNGNPNDSHKMRLLLTPLATLAQRLGIAVVVVLHLNKRSGEPAAVSALYRLAGSLGGISGVARSILLVARDTSDPERRVLAHVGGNLGKEPPSWAFHLVGADNGASRVEWGGPTDLRADDLVARSQASRGQGGSTSKVADATDRIRNLLAAGPRTSNDMEAALRDARCSDYAIKEAKAHLRVVSYHLGDGPSGQWWWRLPNASGT